VNIRKRRKGEASPDDGVCVVRRNTFVTMVRDSEKFAAQTFSGTALSSCLLTTNYRNVGNLPLQETAVLAEHGSPQLLTSEQAVRYHV